MPKDEDYIGFLTACDGFSQYCYTGLIKSKRSEEMKKILSSFFEDNKDTPMKINSDEGNVSKVNLICKTMWKIFFLGIYGIKKMVRGEKHLLSSQKISPQGNFKML